jgi:hypothetical protein
MWTNNEDQELSRHRVPVVANVEMTPRLRVEKPVLSQLFKKFGPYYGK